MLPRPPDPGKRATHEWHLAEAARLLPGGAIGGHALSEALRFVATEGHGARLQDEAGRSYVDYVMGAGSLILGHGDPAVTAAIVAQAKSGTHFAASLNVPAIELAAAACSMIPCAQRFVFANSGTEATHYAIRIAQAFTRRIKILKFQGSSHGNPDYALSAATPGDCVLAVPFNDAGAVRTVMRQHGRDVAAIVVEPIQHIIPPAPGFLASLRTAADQAGAVLIFDEVVTGFRLATGGAQNYFGVRPDLASYGKIIGGGLGMGAVAGRADIIDCVSPAWVGQPGFTYVNGTLHGNPLASAAGLATLRMIRKPGFHATLNDNVAQLRDELSRCVRRYGLPARIVGIGSMWHILFCDWEPSTYIDVLNADMARSRAFDEALIREGIYVLPGMRRLVSSAHDSAAYEETITAFDRVCAKFAA